jgi:hypothetical protein
MKTVEIGRSPSSQSGGCFSIIGIVVRAQQSNDFQPFSDLREISYKIPIPGFINCPWMRGLNNEKQYHETIYKQISQHQLALLPRQSRLTGATGPEHSD